MNWLVGGSREFLCMLSLREIVHPNHFKSACQHYKSKNSVGVRKIRTVLHFVQLCLIRYFYTRELFHLPTVSLIRMSDHTIKRPTIQNRIDPIDTFIQTIRMDLGTIISTNWILIWSDSFFYIFFNFTFRVRKHLHPYNPLPNH